MLRGSDNYAIWAANVRIECEAEEVWQYVTGEITLPSTVPKTPEREATSVTPVLSEDGETPLFAALDIDYAEEKRRFRKYDAKARRIITFSVSDSIRESIVDLPTTQSRWNYLKRYKTSNYYEVQMRRDRAAEKARSWKRKLTTHEHAQLL